jgi:ubiquinone/menaquinone biosynthesis C-methylase UbiE
MEAVRSRSGNDPAARRRNSDPAMAEDAGLLFNRVAEAYDRVRPGYPEPLVDAACAAASLQPGSLVLEVGCGTGKLTGALVERGLRVDAVDPGPELVGIARRRLQERPVRFHVARFEDVELPARSYDAAFSATAFHWVDPAVGWSKVARLLRRNGLLALLSHVGGSLLELEGEFRAAWREVSPEAQSWTSRDDRTLWDGAEARRDNVSELWAWLTERVIARPEARDLFGEVRLAKVLVERDETAEELLAVIRTTSQYLRLDPPRQRLLEKRLATIVERAGGIYRSRTFATLVTARARNPVRAKRS